MFLNESNSKSLNAGLILKDITQLIVNTATSLTNAKQAFIYTYNSQTNTLKLDTQSQVQRINLQKNYFSADETRIKQILETNEPIILSNISNESKNNHELSMYQNINIQNLICLPLTNKKYEFIGILEVINKKNAYFDDDDAYSLKTLIPQITSAFDNLKFYSKLKKIFYQIINSFAETIEKRDPYAGGHANRVRKYSTAIGQALNLPETDLTRLEVAAILHDIGKVKVDSKLLRKNEPLTEQEFATIKQHAILGTDILSHIDGIDSILPGIKSHHERYDGNGYPEGLKENQIDIIARIIAVADSFDAMTSDRPYRNRISIDIALEELKKHAGSQFDPSIVNTFLNIFNKGVITIEV